MLKNRGLPIVCSDSITDFHTFNKVVYVLNSNLQVIPPLEYKFGIFNRYSSEFLLTFVDYKVLNDSLENDSIRKIRSIDPYEPRDYTYSSSVIATRKQSRMFRKIAKKINKLISD